VRAIALHADVLVATSAIWQTNCVIVRAGAGTGAGAGGSGGEGDGAENDVVSEGKNATERAADSEQAAGSRGETFVVDSPILPDELQALGALVEQAGFPVPSGLLATHGDWDHLLGRLAFGDLTLGCAESTAERMRASPGEAQRELRAFDREHFIERERRALSLGAVQALPVPGSCQIGARELALHPAPGHTGDGQAILIEWAGVLLAGDYLSPVELPVLGPGGTAEAYADTLQRLRPLVGHVEHVVPGHGHVLGRDRALEILEEDLAYVRDTGPSGSTRLRRSSRSAHPPRSAHPRRSAARRSSPPCAR
jgi:glyoxylase-like metal-dependent hydrolase (beta-lactamase superfamily II)